MNIAHLSDRAVARIAGKDAASFLQGLITNDMKRVEAGEVIFTALLSPQGKFLFDFFIIPEGDVLLIEADKAKLPELLKRLSFYKLRAAVTFEALPDYQVAAVWDDKANEGFSDPRLAALGSRIVGTTLPTATASMEDYERHRIALGVPDGAKDLVYDRSLLLAYGYDALNAVSFTKGCYVGQEVTARSKHRGQLRRALYQVKGAATLPAQGAPVLMGEESIGELASVAGNIGLALLEREAVEAGKSLNAGGISVKATLPEWWV